MPAMIKAPVTTTPMRTRCIRVSCSGAATRTPLPLPDVARNRVAHAYGERGTGRASGPRAQLCFVADLDGEALEEADLDGDLEACFDGDAEEPVPEPDDEEVSLADDTAPTASLIAFS